MSASMKPCDPDGPSIALEAGSRLISLSNRQQGRVIAGNALSALQAPGGYGQRCFRCSEFRRASPHDTKRAPFTKLPETQVMVPPSRLHRPPHRCPNASARCPTPVRRLVTRTVERYDNLQKMRFQVVGMGYRGHYRPLRLLQNRYFGVSMSIGRAQHNVVVGA